MTSCCRIGRGDGRSPDIERRVGIGFGKKKICEMETDDKSSSNVSSIVRFKSREKLRDAEKASPPVSGSDFRDMKLATSRRETDPWEDILAGVKSRPALAGSIDWEGGEQRVSSNFLLTGMLHLTGAKMRGSEGKRLAKCMRKLGWH